MLYVELIEKNAEKMVFDSGTEDFGQLGKTKNWEEPGTLEYVALSAVLEAASNRDTFVEMNSILEEEMEELEKAWKEINGSYVKFSRNPEAGYVLEVKWVGGMYMMYRGTSEVGHVTWGYVE